MKDNNKRFTRWLVTTLIAVGCAIAGAGVAWGIFKGGTEKTLAAHHDSNTRQDRQLGNHEVRLRDVEITQAKVDAKLESLQDGQQEIKQLIKHGG